MIEFIILLGLFWISFAVFQDLKKREIANWISFSLIVFALAFRAFYSIFSNDYRPFLWGIIGLTVFFILGNLLYYARFFAGGDAKLMIALGALIPFANNWQENALIAIIFIFSVMLLGGVYTIIYSGVLAYFNYDKFSKEFSKEFAKNENYMFAGFIFMIILMFLSFISSQAILSILGLMILIIPLIYTYSKAIESSCMIKSINPKDLTIGDWLAESIKIRKKTIEPNWEGLSEEELNIIKKSYKKKVLVKEGIPFSPSFMLAFLVLIYIKYFWAGNWQIF